MLLALLCGENHIQFMYLFHKMMFCFNDSTMNQKIHEQIILFFELNMLNESMLYSLFIILENKTVFSER